MSNEVWSDKTSFKQRWFLLFFFLLFCHLFWVNETQAFTVWLFIISTASSSYNSLDANIDDKSAVQDASVFDVLARPWSPCTRSQSILSYLHHSHFPTSYRPLCAQWKALGRPRLQTAMTINLDDAALREEAASLMAPTTHQVRTTEEFLSFCHNYCSYSVELEALESAKHHVSFDAETAYDYNKRMLLRSLDVERLECQCIPVHDCLGIRLWGEYDFSIRREVNSVDSILCISHRTSIHLRILQALAPFVSISDIGAANKYSSRHISQLW